MQIVECPSHAEDEDLHYESTSTNPARTQKKSIKESNKGMQHVWHWIICKNWPSLPLVSSMRFWDVLLASSFKCRAVIYRVNKASMPTVMYCNHSTNGTDKLSRQRHSFIHWASSMFQWWRDLHILCTFQWNCKLKKDLQWVWLTTGGVPSPTKRYQRPALYLQSLRKVNRVIFLRKLVNLAQDPNCYQSDFDFSAQSVCVTELDVESKRREFVWQISFLKAGTPDSIKHAKNTPSIIDSICTMIDKIWSKEKRKPHFNHSQTQVTEVVVLCDSWLQSWTWTDIEMSLEVDAECQTWGLKVMSSLQIFKYQRSYRSSFSSNLNMSWRVDSDLFKKLL